MVKRGRPAPTRYYPRPLTSSFARLVQHILLVSGPLGELLHAQKSFNARGDPLITHFDLRVLARRPRIGRLRLAPGALGFREFFGEYADQLAILLRV